MIQGTPLRLAQLTDLHLFADPARSLFGVPTAASLQLSVAKLRQHYYPQDLLLLTGDLSQDETAESYRQLRQLLDPLQIPTYWLPGNHDNLAAMGEILSQPPFSADQGFQVGNWSFVSVDSTVAGETYGELSPTRLEWLDWQLHLTGDRPTVVSLHHPPFEVNSLWIDRIGLRNPKRFFDILDRHRNVRFVLSGHVHQNFCHQQGRLRCFATPSTCVQFKPRSAEFAIDAKALPGFRLFNLYPNGSWETKVERVKGTVKPDLPK